MSYQWWEKALKGEQVEIHENDPRPGYFRVRRKGEPWEPVAIWVEDGALVALRGDREVSPQDIWTYAAKNPVTYEAYTAAMDGKGWPEDIDAEIAAAQAEKASTAPAEATTGHNSGVAPHEVIRDEIDTVAQAFQTWLANIGGEIKTEEHDAKLTEFQQRVHALGKKAEDTRTAEKRPVLEQGRAIDAAWKPAVDSAERVKKLIGQAALAYRIARNNARKAEEARLAAERRKAEEEARAAAAKAAAEAAAAGKAEEEIKAAAEEAAAAAAPPPAREPQRPVKTGLRTVKVCQITDLRACVMAILDAAPDHPDIMDAARIVARRMIESGVPVAGAAIVEEKRA